MKLGYVLSCTTGSRCVGVRNDPRVDRLGCGSILGRAEGGRESRVHWVCSSNAVSESGKDRKWEGVIALLRRDANGFGYFGPALDLFEPPQDSSTRALLAAVPVVRPWLLAKPHE